ncbi:MAG: hypothetical protein HYV46_11765 [candidate division NC10 bacterium]|nr:hypothetical protein [candidate division NC10 bacterium]
MMIRLNMRRMWWGAGVLALALAACSQQSGQTTVAPSPQEEKTFTLTPNASSVKLAFLTGQLRDLRVTERVDRATGKVVDPPWLHATLKLKNVSTDQAARLISGKLQYLDAEGNPIALAKERGDTSFSFSTYQMDRLDPGMETSQVIEVPFIPAALEAKKLQNIRLELTFTPVPYTEEAVDIPVALKG